MSIKRSIKKLKKVFHSARERREVKTQIKSATTVKALLAGLDSLDQAQKASLFEITYLNNPRSDRHIGRSNAQRRHLRAQEVTAYSMHSYNLLNQIKAVLSYYDALFPQYIGTDKKQAVGIHLERLKLLRLYKHELKTINTIMRGETHIFISPLTEAQFDNKKTHYQTECNSLLLNCELPPQFDAQPSRLLRLLSFFRQERTHHIDAAPPAIAGALPTYDQSPTLNTQIEPLPAYPEHDGDPLHNPSTQGDNVVGGPEPDDPPPAYPGPNPF